MMKKDQDNYYGRYLIAPLYFLSVCYVLLVLIIIIQWNLSIVDTIGTGQTVLSREVSLQSSFVH